MTDQKPFPTEESAFHGQRVPLVQAKPAHQALFPYFLVVLGTLLVVGGAGFWWMNSATRAEIEAKKADALKVQLTKEFEAESLRREQERQRKQEEQVLAEQRAAHARLAERIESALARVAELEAAQKEWRELHESLKETPVGREIAASDDLITKFVTIERDQPAATFATAPARERLASLAVLSKKIAAGSDVAVAPSPEVSDGIATDIAQADIALQSQVKSNQALHALISEAKASVLPPADVDLDEAVASQAQRREQTRQQALADAERRGQEETEKRMRELAERKAKENTEIEIDDATRDFDRQQAAIKKTNDELHAAKLAKDEQQVALLKAKLDKEIAELRGEVGCAEAEVHVTEASAKAKQSEKEQEAQRIADEAEKNRLREKAKSPEVAAALAPFLAKGFWQPGHAKAQGIDPVPVSFSALQGAGALTATPGGLHQLYKFGAAPENDRAGGWSAADRLIGKGDDAWLKNKPDAVATARKAQQLLNELGPTLVELGLLAP